MNFRVTIILLVVLAALGGALAFSERQNGAAPERATDQQGELAIFSLSAADFERLELQRGGESRRFQKTSTGEWTLQPTGDQADQPRLEALAARLANLRGIRRIPAGEANLESYGLASSPQLSVQLTLKNGQSHSLRIGEKTPVETGYYAQADQESDVFVLSSLLVTDLERVIEQPLAPTPTITPRSTAPAATPAPSGTPSSGGAPAATPAVPSPSR